MAVRKREETRETDPKRRRGDRGFCISSDHLWRMAKSEPSRNRLTGFFFNLHCARRFWTLRFEVYRHLSETAPFLVSCFQKTHFFLSSHTSCARERPLPVSGCSLSHSSNEGALGGLDGFPWSVRAGVWSVRTAGRIPEGPQHGFWLRSFCFRLCLRSHVLPEDNAPLGRL